MLDCISLPLTKYHMRCNRPATVVYWPDWGPHYDTHNAAATYATNGSICLTRRGTWNLNVAVLVTLIATVVLSVLLKTVNRRNLRFKSRTMFGDRARPSTAKQMWCVEKMPKTIKARKLLAPHDLQKIATLAYYISRGQFEGQCTCIKRNQSKTGTPLVLSVL